MAMVFDEIAVRLRTDEPVPGSSEARETVLRALKSAFDGSQNPYDHRTAMNASIGATTDRQLRRQLVAVRDELDARAIKAMIADVEQAMARSRDEGWKTWLRLLSEAVVRFRHRHARALCDASFDFGDERRQQREELGRAVRCIEQSRWDEVDETFGFLADRAGETSIPAKTAARLITLHAQIELWRFTERKRAAALLARADQVAPGDPMVLSTLGDLAAEQRDGERAVGYYARAIAAGPEECNGYVGMGEWSEKEEQRETAEKWFRQGIAKAAGESTSYDRLLRLLAGNDGLRKNRPVIDELMDRRLALDPEGEYDALLMMGEACRTNAKLPNLPAADKRAYFAQARTWFERATSLNPQWPLGYTSLADLSKDEEDLAQVDKWARRAMEVAPECPSSYFLLGQVAIDNSRWDEAARIFQRFPPRPRRWKLYANATIGRIQSELRNYDQARSILLEVLREEVSSGLEQVFSLVNLENLADDWFRNRNDSAKAAGIYDDILSIKGESYRGRYHYLLGSLHSHDNAHQAAVIQYRAAIAAAPQDISYHRALGDALRTLGLYDEAVRAAEDAFAIDGDDKRRRDALAALANLDANRRFEREDYEGAIGHYTIACDLEPGIAVYRSNLALALERVKVPGKRSEFLEMAAHAWSRAQQIAGDQRHAERIERLRRRASLAAAYGDQALDWIAVVTPIFVDIADDLVPFVANDARTGLSPVLEKEVEAMRSAFFASQGITLPGIRFRSEPGLPPGMFVIQLDEVPMVSAQVKSTDRFFPGTAGQLSALGVSGAAASDPVSQEPGLWVVQKDWVKLQSSQPALWTVTRYMLRKIESVVRHHLEAFVGHQELVTLLRTLPDPLASTISKTPEALSALTNTCRALASELVPIQPLESLNQTVKSLVDTGTRPREIAERFRLLPAVRDSLPGRSRPTYLRTSERFESVIRAGLKSQGDHVVLALPPEPCQAALTAIREALKATEERNVALLVADQTLRPFVRRLVELEHPDVPVLAVAEARDDVQPLTTRVDMSPTTDKPVIDTGAAAQSGTFTSSPAATARMTAVPGSPAVTISIARSRRAEISEADGQPLDVLLTVMRDGLFQEIGLMVPVVTVREDDSLTDGAFEIRICNGPVDRIEGLAVNEILINDGASGLRWLEIHGREVPNPATGIPNLIVTATSETLAICRQTGLTVWGPSGYMVLQLSVRLRREAASLHTLETTRHLLDSVAGYSPELVELALQRFGLPTLTEVFRHLLAEEISIRNVRTILEALLCLDGTVDLDLNRFIVFASTAEPLCIDRSGRRVVDLSPSRLADYVRTWMRFYISHKYTRGASTLAVYLLDSTFEERLRHAGSSELADDARRLTEAVKREMARHAKETRPVLLTNFDVRAKVRGLLRSAIQGLTVLSYQELSPQLNITPLARIRLDGGDAV